MATIDKIITIFNDNSIPLKLIYLLYSNLYCDGGYIKYVFSNFL